MYGSITFISRESSVLCVLEYLQVIKEDFTNNVSQSVIATDSKLRIRTVKRMLLKIKIKC